MIWGRNCDGGRSAGDGGRTIEIFDYTFMRFMIIGMIRSDDRDDDDDEGKESESKVKIFTFKGIVKVMITQLIWWLIGDPSSVLMNESNIDSSVQDSINI
jgi:hypothetical protein